MKKIFYSLLFLFFGYSTVLAQQQVTCGVFTFDVLITPATCNGDCDGAIQITNISGGTPPYNYFWSTGHTVPNPIGLCAGAYTVTITDAVNNTCTMTFTVPQPAPIQVSEIVTDASCASCCDGDIQLTVTGGTPPYLVVFSSPSPYCPGSYNYCVLDNNNCSFCDSATVSFTTFINEDNISGGFSVYPNPTKGIFTIEHNLKGDNYILEIIDLMGKVVHQEKITTKKQTINTEQLSKGVYFVNLKSDTGKLVYTTKMSIVN
ncbi:MAG: T9SS type A sorting domain-containing protein [Flavobacteriales bacterium]